MPKIRTQLKLAILFLIVSTSYGVEAFEIECGQNISALQHLEIEYINTMFAMKWYKAPIDSISFGKVTPVFANYLFLNSKYYGKSYTITGNDNINYALNHLKKELEISYSNDKENTPSDFPVHKNHYWTFIHPKKVIILKRYSVHTATIEIICRTIWENHDFQNFTEIY